MSLLRCALFLFISLVIQSKGGNLWWSRLNPLVLLCSSAPPGGLEAPLLGCLNRKWLLCGSSDRFQRLIEHLLRISGPDGRRIRKTHTEYFSPSGLLGEGAGFAAMPSEGSRFLEVLQTEELGSPDAFSILNLRAFAPLDCKRWLEAAAALSSRRGC